MEKVKEAQRSEPVGPTPAPEEISILREYYVTIITCLILALFVTTFVAHPMSVPTPSMVPTIMVGDRLIVDKFTLRADTPLAHTLRLGRDIRRFDIIVFKYPENPEVPYVKRVIGLPNEIITIHNRQIFINDQLLPDPYGKYGRLAMESHYRYGNTPYTIPDNSYFMMGDNRDNSADSRFWGVVPRSYVIGRPLFAFWSYEDDSYEEIQRKGAPKVFLERILYFFPKTRWSRMFKQIK